MLGVSEHRVRTSSRLSGPPDPAITFSVVIPTRNRPRRLLACLESFRRMEYPADLWELIVVDDGGEQSFALIPEGLRRGLPLRRLEIRSSGPAAARNAGAKVASGEYLAFTDDDCLVEPDWLTQLSSGFAGGKWDALGGRSLNPIPEDAGATAWHLLIEFLYEYLRDENGNCLLLVANNAAYKREAFEAVGGFDPQFPWAAAEDRDLSFRLYAAKFALGYHPGAKVWHYLEGVSGRRYLTRQFFYGRGGFYFERNVKRLGAFQVFQSLKGTLPEYHFALWRALAAARVRPEVRVLLYLGHIAHRLGVLYQGTALKLGSEWWRRATIPSPVLGSEGSPSDGGTLARDVRDKPA